MLMAHLTACRNTCDRGPELLFDPGRHGVGAVLVRNRRMIAGGYNGSAPGQPHCSDPPEFIACKTCSKTANPDFVHQIPGRGLVGICHTCDGEKQMEKRQGGHLMVEGHCVHSEMNALMQCALDGVSPAGATLYCTASPCFDCGKAIIRAGITKVFYGQAYESRYGLSGRVRELLESSGIVVEELVISRKDLR